VRARCGLSLTCCMAAVALARCSAAAPSFDPRTMPAFGPTMAMKGTALLYVATDAGENTVVSIFTYPKVKFVGSVTSDMAFARVCSDPKTGHVFVSQSAGLDEYQRGGTTKIATLAAPEGYTQLLGCSIDPLSGDVAAVAYESKGGLLIYPHGTGTPLIYSDPTIHAYYYCSYDDSGNLFALGYGLGSTSVTSVFTELHKGGKVLRDIALSAFIGYPQKLQWDGKYMALNEGGTIYQVQVSGSNGKIVGTTRLLGDTEPAGGTVWIAGDTVLGPHGGEGARRVGTWNYPAGGNPLRVTPHVGGKHTIISDINLSVTTPEQLPLRAEIPVAH
jgi:hypothetical protein